MSEISNPPAEQPKQGGDVQKLPIPDSRGPNQHQAVPTPLGDGPDATHNFFMNRLAQERAGEVAGANTPDPVLNESMGQPPVPAREVGTPEPPVQRQPGADQPVRTEQVLPDQPAEQAGQPVALEEEGIEVDGERYTPDHIRQLLTEAHEGGLRQADYTRKTQALSRVRQEAQALGHSLTEAQEALERKANVIDQVVNASVANLEAVDVSRLDQAQHAQFQEQYRLAKQAQENLQRTFAEVDADAQKAKQKAYERMSAETTELLAFHEPRWDRNNRFYSEVRDYVVGEGIMSDEAFLRENDFLRMLGLISLMDRHKLPETIRDSKENPRPPERQQNAPQRDSSGRFQSDLNASQAAVLSSQNARRDGSARDFFRNKLADERRRGVQPRNG